MISCRDTRFRVDVLSEMSENVATGSPDEAGYHEAVGSTTKEHRGAIYLSSILVPKRV